MNSVPLLAATLALTLSLAPSGANAAGKPAPAPPAEPPPPPKSVFSIEPGTSRDPFFPKSTRLTQIVAQTNDLVTPPPLPAFPDELRCQGISGTLELRVALVNNKTVQKGEEIDLPLKTGQRVRVRCVDVKESSVTLEVNGVTKELFLRAGLR